MKNEVPQILGEVITLSLKDSHQDEPDNKDFEKGVHHLNLDIFDFCYDEIKGLQEHIYFTADRKSRVRLFVDENTGNRWVELQGQDAMYLKEELAIGLEFTEKQVKKTVTKKVEQKSESFSLFKPTTWFKK